VTVGAACAAPASHARADEARSSPAPSSTVPLSATSQCVEGPGAPPADPSKVTRVPTAAASHGAKAPPAAEQPIDEPEAPGKPDPILLELGALAGVSARFDDAPAYLTTGRAGLAVGGSLFLWTSRTLAFGADYAHVDLSRSETAPGSTTIVGIDYSAHTLFAEARVTPFRFGPAAFFASLGGGLAWQTATLKATFISVNGARGGSSSCEVGSNVEFAFRAGVGMKARLSRAASLLVDAAFVGYRLTGDVLGNCAPGAGTAQTVLTRVGLTYDLDISRLVR
jgi:hypothetical protein